MISIKKILKKYVYNRLQALSSETIWAQCWIELEAMEVILKVPLVVTDFSRFFSLYFHWLSKLKYEENYSILHSFNHFHCSKESDRALWKPSFKGIIVENYTVYFHWILPLGRFSKSPCPSVCHVCRFLRF